MEEREFFNETTEQRTHNLVCPKCGQAGEYKVTWVVRRKRAQLPRGADERDRARGNEADKKFIDVVGRNSFEIVVHKFA